MKKSILIILAFLIFYSCGSKNKTLIKIQPLTETINTVDGENLDLELVGQLAMKCANSEELEKKLNDPATKLNNLDLDGDGNVDWITVTDGPSDNPNARLMSLSVQFSETDIEEIATIEIDKTSDSGGEVHLVGSETVYGSGAHYRSNFSFTDAVLFHYMFTPRYRPYYSPYYAYRPPVYYSPYRPVPMTTYRTTNRIVHRSSSSSFSKSTTTRQSKVTSPNKGKTSSKATTQRQVKSKNQSQKSMNKATTADKNKLKSGKSAFKKTDTKKPNSNTIKKTPTKKPNSYKKTPTRKPTRSRTSRTKRR